MNNIKLLISSVAALSGIVMSQQSFAAYKDPNSYKYPQATIVMGESSRYSTSGADDTQAFNNAIIDVNNAGGGRVIVPAGDYVVHGTSLKDNVHLVIDKDATLMTLDNSDTITMFNGLTLKNASVRGSNGQFKAILRGPGNTGKKLYHGKSVKNFMLKNIDIVDPNPTAFQTIALGWEEFPTNGVHSPTDVTIVNITKDSRSHIGYGIMQAQACRNTNFINMKGKGGVPVRLETGAVPMQLRGRDTGGIHNIRIENCVSTEAATTVKINPHSMLNGDVLVLNCSATASGTVVALEPGHAHKQALKDAGLGSGSFGKVTIKGTTGIYRPTGAPYKYGFFAIMPEGFVSNYPNHNLFYKTPSDSCARDYRNDYIGPSLGVLLLTGHARDGLTTKWTSKVVDAQYGNVDNHFRKTISELVGIGAWMTRNIPVTDVPWCN